MTPFQSLFILDCFLLCVLQTGQLALFGVGYRVTKSLMLLFGVFFFALLTLLLSRNCYRRTERGVLIRNQPGFKEFKLMIKPSIRKNSGPLLKWLPHVRLVYKCVSSTMCCKFKGARPATVAITPCLQAPTSHTTT